MTTATNKVDEVVGPHQQRIIYDGIVAFDRIREENDPLRMLFRIMDRLSMMDRRIEYVNGHLTVQLGIGKYRVCDLTVKPSGVRAQMIHRADPVPWRLSGYVFEVVAGEGAVVTE